MDTRAELVRAFGLDSEDQVQLGGERFGDDGFLSFRRAARISRTQAEPLHVFVKSSDPSRNDLAGTQAASNEFCRNECVFYGLFAPILDSALARCQLPPVFPRAYAQRFCDSGSILVMEDLQHEGYKLVGRKQLTLPEAQCVVKAMASLQAAYWVARYSFDFTMDDAIFGWESPFWNLTGKAVKAKNLDFSSMVVEGMKYFNENLLLHLKQQEDEMILRDKSRQILQQMHETMQGRFPKDTSMPLGLIHGDLWLSNVMFKGSGESMTCRIFDWQFWGPGVFGEDLGQFLLTSLPHQVLVSEMENLVELHYATFREIYEAKTGQAVPFSEEAAKSTLKPSLTAAVMWIVITSMTLWEKGLIDVGEMLTNAAFAIRKWLPPSPSE